MAKMNSIIGEVNGKLGEVVGQNWKGKRVLRKYTANVHNPHTNEQERSRAIFGKLATMSSGFYDVIDMSMNAEARKRGPMTAGNLFTRENYNTVNITEDGAIEVDYTRLVVSTGNLTGAEFGNLRVEDSTNLSVTFNSQEKETRNCKKDDMVYMYAYCDELNEGVLSEGVKRSAHTIGMSVPNHWVGKKVMVYGFVAGGEKNTTKGRYSTSQYVGTQMLA